MLNIIDLETQFSKQKISKSKKLSLREIEEDKKNHFICFVDEGEESYDAQISISEKLEIIDFSCDCSEKGFCNHLLALAIHIFEIKNNKPTKKTKLKAKKISEAELAIENLNSEEIKGWILEFFKKNKEAEIQFLLEFGEKKTDFSDHEIKSIIDKSIQSVVGKKKNITAPEIKKIVDILTKSLEPVEEFMWQNITKNIALETYNLICDHLLSFQMNIYTTSNRIESFIDKFRTKFAINFNQIKDQSVWEILAQEYWNYYLKGTGSIPHTLYHLLFDIYKYADIPQKKFIAKLVKEKIDIWIKNDVGLRTELREHLLDIMIENEMFFSVKSYFPIAFYQNSYNIKILNELLKFDKNLVEKYCNVIINRNSNEKYNYPYYEILEKLYLENNDLGKLAIIKKLKFQGNPTLEDYIFIEQNEIDNGEFKKFRTKILANLRRSFYQYPENAEIYFQILEYEKNYTKMLDVIDENLPTFVINQYSEKLYLIDKEKFLVKVSRRSSWNSVGSEDEKLADFLVSKYDNAHLKSYFSKNSFGFGSYGFSSLVLKKLK